MPIQRTQLRALLLMALLLAPSAAAARAPSRGYTIDVDPIRLGTKAFEEGRLDEAKAKFEEAVANDYQVHKAKAGPPRLPPIRSGVSQPSQAMGPKR